MKIILTVLLMFAQSGYALDAGDGSDGSCDVLGTAATQITAARKTYQCTSLTINDNLNVFSGAGVGAGGPPLVIKVQNDVTVSAGFTLDLSGANGEDGDNVNSVKSAGPAGAGGSAGGSSPGAAVDGNNGSGIGGGVAGKNVNSNPGSSYGGGGGGGAYKTRIAVEPVGGHDSTNPVPASAGLNGSTYGSESSFESSFLGGSGGGAGGGGDDTLMPFTGSSGGGGGGAVRIIAGGDIAIQGIILANGGNGGGIAGTTNSGGGGGGSGGAIWLQAAGSITVSATGALSATGGTKGINDLLVGVGGDGGDGRIRLDDRDGIIEIEAGGSVTPAAYSTTFSITTEAVTSRQYSSSISCARVRTDQTLLPFLLALLLGLGFSKFLFIFISSKRVT